jgi:glycosyltransferase involved in cell wall biosynthesis
VPADEQRRTGPASLDIVIPMYNEAPVLPALLTALEQTFAPSTLERHGISDVTCLFVDDGSDDRSAELVRDHRSPNLKIIVLRLSRNFGHQAAVTAGVAHSSADLVAVMDADLQDPPEYVVDMIDRWRDGFDVVYGVRRHRKEGALKVFLYWAFYRAYSVLSIAVPADSGDFCLMSRRVVDELNRLPEKVRFARGLRTWVGFRQTAIDYHRPLRHAGETHYGLRDLYRLATEGIASLSLRPLQAAQLLSILYLFSTLVGFGGLLLGLFDRLTTEAQLSLLFLLVLVSNGIILFCLYVLGAYVGRAYLEVKGRPSYIVAEVIRPADRPPLPVARESISITPTFFHPEEGSSGS